MSKEDPRNLTTIPMGTFLASDVAFMKKHPEYTKVSFPVSEHGNIANECMWVRILDGDQNCGYGRLDNEPQWAEYVAHEDIVEYAFSSTLSRPTFVRKREED